MVMPHQPSQVCVGLLLPLSDFGPGGLDTAASEPDVLRCTQESLEQPFNKRPFGGLMDFPRLHGCTCLSPLTCCKWQKARVLWSYMGHGWGENHSWTWMIQSFSSDGAQISKWPLRRQRCCHRVPKVQWFVMTWYAQTQWNTLKNTFYQQWRIVLWGPATRKAEMYFTPTWEVMETNKKGILPWNYWSFNLNTVCLDLIWFLSTSPWDHFWKECGVSSFKDRTALAQHLWAISVLLPLLEPLKLPLVFN